MSRGSSSIGLVAFGGLVTLLVGTGCFSSSVGVDGQAPFVSLLTGSACEPDAGTFLSRSSEEGGEHRYACGEVEVVVHGKSGEHGQGGAKSPTGIPGDNMDDQHSGKIDCLGDGNSGQGDDARHPCGCVEEDFPQPGCDADGCCQDSGEQPPAEEPPAEDPAADEPPATEPPPAEPPAEEPPAEEPPAEEPPAEEPPADDTELEPPV